MYLSVLMHANTYSKALFLIICSCAMLITNSVITQKKKKKTLKAFLFNFGGVAVVNTLLLTRFCTSENSKLRREENVTGAWTDRSKKKKKT